MNPALAARAFLFSWPVIMTTWVQPGDWAPLFGSSADAVTSATPLASLHQSALPAESLMSLFLGKTGGCLGETSALLLSGRPVPGSPAGHPSADSPLLIWVPWPFSPCSFPGNDPLLWMGSHLLSGGLMLGAWFMATDYVTSPVTGWGRFSTVWAVAVSPSSFRYFGSIRRGQLCHFDDERLCGLLLDKVGAGLRRFGLRRKGGCKMKNRKKRTYRRGDPISHHRRHGWPSCSGEFRHCRAHCGSPAGKDGEGPLWGPPGGRGAGRAAGILPG